MADLERTVLLEFDADLCGDVEIWVGVGSLADFAQRCGLVLKRAEIYDGANLIEGMAPEELGDDD